MWTSGDDGQTWDQVTWPQPPANCVYDWITEPVVLALYVSFAGRSLVKIADRF